jgi:IS6 family transposase
VASSFWLARLRVKGQEKYLYRAVDSTGQTIDFLLTAKRDAAAAERFFQKVFSCSANPVPRVINVDKNPAYPAAIRVLKQEGGLPQLVGLRQCKFLNHVIEQDHRTVKKRTWLAKGYNTFQSAWRTLEGIETVNMIRKGRVKWVAKGDAETQARFVPIQDHSSLDLCSLKLRNGTIFRNPEPLAIQSRNLRRHLK